MCLSPLSKLFARSTVPWGRRCRRSAPETGTPNESHRAPSAWSPCWLRPHPTCPAGPHAASQVRSFVSFPDILRLFMGLVLVIFFQGSNDNSQTSNQCPIHLGGKISLSDCRTKAIQQFQKVISLLSLCCPIQTGWQVVNNIFRAIKIGNNSKSMKSHHCITLEIVTIVISDCFCPDIFNYNSTRS